MTSVDNTNVLSDLRNKREVEVEDLKKDLVKERDEHEQLIQTMRNKYQVYKSTFLRESAVYMIF